MKKRKHKIIAVDFDGTLCRNAFPNIGKPRKWVIRRLLKAQHKGAKIILNTCRTGTRLYQAVVWCEARGIKFDAVNENLPEIIALFGGDTRKIHATEYWDDKAVMK